MRLVELIVLLLTLEDGYMKMEGHVIFCFILAFFMCCMRLALGRYEHTSAYPRIHKSRAWWTVASRHSPEWVWVIDMSMTISKTLMPQTHGNGKAILWYEFWELIGLYLKPLYAETVNCSFLLLHGCDLRLLSYRDCSWTLANQPHLIHILYNKCTKFPGCYWCVSILAFLYVCMLFLHSPVALVKSVPKLCRLWQWSSEFIGVT